MLYSDQDKEKARALRVEGKSLAQISNMTGFGINTVINFCRGIRLTSEQRGANRKDRTLDDKRVLVAKLRKQGKTLAQIELETGLTQGSIQYLLYSQDVTLTAEQNRAVRGGVAYSDADVERILELRRSGVPLSQIASHFGMERANVKAICAARSVLLSDEQLARNLRLATVYTKEQEDMVTELRGSGVSIKDIVGKTSLSVSAVKWICIKHKIKLKSVQLINNKYRLKLVPGQIFGDLVVLRASGNRWLCRCKCGREVCLRASSLVGSHSTRSCGCSRWLEIVSGQVYGHLTVLTFEPDNNSNGDRVWKCRCKCGREKLVAACKLVIGSVQSCGCLRSSVELDILDYIQSLGFPEARSTQEIIRNPKGNKCELDIYVESKKIAFEYCGLHWHGELLGGPGVRYRHLEKLEACSALGIALITIFADEWLTRQDIFCYVIGFLCVGFW